MQIAYYSSVSINKYTPSVPDITLNALHILCILILLKTLGGRRGILLLSTVRSSGWLAQDYVSTK